MKTASNPRKTSGDANIAHSPPSTMPSSENDASQFENPDFYDITRRPKRHLGFGGGVHSCLGAMLARVATEVIFSEFLKVVPEFTRVDDVLPWVPSSNFRSPQVLRLTRG